MKIEQRIFGPIVFNPNTNAFSLDESCGFHNSDSRWNAISLIRSAEEALNNPDTYDVRGEITEHDGTESIVLGIGNESYVTLQARKFSGAWRITGHSYWHQAGKCLASIVMSRKKGEDNAD